MRVDVFVLANSNCQSPITEMTVAKKCQNTLRSWRKIAAEDGKPLQRPCRPEQIARLQEQTEAELNANLPLEYMDFLRLTNGYMWNGLEIYACETVPPNVNRTSWSQAWLKST